MNNNFQDGDSSRVTENNTIKCILAYIRRNNLREIIYIATTN